MTTIRVNGEERSIRSGTIAELLAEMGLDGGRSGIAVAVDGSLVPRRAWAEARLGAGRAVEIITAVQGG